MSQGNTFRVGLTRDFLRPDGTLGLGDIGLEMLDEAPGVAWEFLAEGGRELRADQVGDYDALILLSARVTAATLAGADRLALIARFGVGYDSVDVDACTERGVLLTITPDGVRRPVAVAVIAYLLALSHKMFAKDRLTREGRWAEKLDHMGMGLTGRALGLIGLGNIGLETLTLANTTLPPTPPTSNSTSSPNSTGIAGYGFTAAAVCVQLLGSSAYSSRTFFSIENNVCARS